MALSTLQAELQSQQVLAAEAPPQVLSINDLITQDAAKYGVNRDHLYKTIQCESRFVVDVVGDHGTSFGIAQFHNPVSDWGMTIAEAKTPEYAIDRMAKAFSEGEASRWSCYRLLYE